MMYLHCYEESYEYCGECVVGCVGWIVFLRMVWGCIVGFIGCVLIFVGVYGVCAFCCVGVVGRVW